MMEPFVSRALAAGRPIRMNDPDFARHKYEWYRWMLEEVPVCRARISLMKLDVVVRYEDCRMVLTDERFVRNRARARGKTDGSPLPFPLPRSVAAVARSMILEDDPEHRRLRNLVNKAFTARAVGRLSNRVEEISHERLDDLEKRARVDLMEAYARPIPTRVISEMIGLPRADIRELDDSVRVLTNGFSGLGILRTLLFDLRAVNRFVRALIARKRDDPGDDILSGLIEAEEAGDRLSEDELVAMVFLLIVAGFETTVHLITNGVRTLLEHRDQLDRLRAQPELWDSAVEEIVRYRGPVHGTKPQYAREDVRLHGVTIRRGTPVMPLIGAANHDPRAFEKPDVFDVARSPNHHLGFGFGAHFCLGRPLALMETRIALRNLFERHPDLALGVDPEELVIANLPGWHRHEHLPVVLGSGRDS
ncbi:MAG TPA: cytochrome P450 [Deltaproteobacteria bacterium]|nr:cytochrome P450 [Deltaproteobacteria bacterium]